MTKSKVGNYLRARRLTLHITQEELARRLASYGFEYSASNMAWWETGRSKPPLDEPPFIEALARALETSVSELISALGIYLTTGKDDPIQYSAYDREIIAAARKGDTRRVMELVLKYPPQDTNGNMVG